jgi:alpha-beta hydrolase superfamily lysophospholipase
MATHLTEPLPDWPTGSDLRGYRVEAASPVAALLVVHGFGEHAERHAKTMRLFASRGISAYAYDHRGHGRSPGKRAFAARFDDLISESLAIRDRVAAEHPGLPLFLFGASMGGAIAARNAQLRPAGLRGVVLLAPAFAVAEHIAPPVQNVLRVLRRFAPGLPLPKLDVALLADDPAVGAAYAADPLTFHGGIPLATALGLGDAGAAAVAEAGRYDVPTLLLQGDADKIVFPVGARRFVEAATNARDLTYRVVPGGYHELFNDRAGDALAAEAAEWIVART